MFNEKPVSWWVYNLSKLIIEQPKDTRNGKRAQLAVLLNELEKAEESYTPQLEFSFS